jgi:hypothetical protein
MFNATAEHLAAVRYYQQLSNRTYPVTHMVIDGKSFGLGADINTFAHFVYKWTQEVTYSAYDQQCSRHSYLKQVELRGGFPSFIANGFPLNCNYTQLNTFDDTQISLELSLQSGTYQRCLITAEERRGIISHITGYLTV